MNILIAVILASIAAFMLALMIRYLRHTPPEYLAGLDQDMAEDSPTASTTTATERRNPLDASATSIAYMVFMEAKAYSPNIDRALLFGEFARRCRQHDLSIDRRRAHELILRLLKLNELSMTGRVGQRDHWLLNEKGYLAARAVLFDAADFAADPDRTVAGGAFTGRGSGASHRTDRQRARVLPGVVWFRQL